MILVLIMCYERSYARCIIVLFTTNNPKGNYPLNDFGNTFQILGHANNHEQRQNDIYLVRNLCHLHLLCLQLEHIQKQNLLLLRSNTHIDNIHLHVCFAIILYRQRKKNKDIFTLLGVMLKQRITRIMRMLFLYLCRIPTCRLEQI